MHTSEMQETIEEKSLVFDIIDNNASNCCVKFSYFRREYFSSVVNVLTNSVKISEQTKGDFAPTEFTSNS